MLQELSEQLLLAVKQEEPVAEFEDRLASAPVESLNDLTSDVRKIAFWVNIYNAWYQILRGLRDVDKPSVYRLREIVIGPVDCFSLDEIEHGILRRCRLKYGAGYLANPFARRRLRQLMVEKIDWRIHFALNCGAQSCPPIAFYSVDRLDSQLDMATSSFLQSDTEIDHAKKEVRVTKIFRWFAADFGGKAGIRSLLSDRLDVDLGGYGITYKPYLWDDELGNFS